MADKTGTIRITASTELGELQKLNTSLDNMQANFMKATVGATSLSGVVSNLASKLAEELVTALRDAAVNLGKFIEAGDDFNDTVGGDRESVWKLTEATQHMGAAMDVARFRAKLMASEGLKPTEQQLEALTVAATRLAAKQKTEWNEAAEKLSNTWQGMGTRALKPLNLTIDQNLSLMDRQEQMLAGLVGQGEAVLTQAEKEKALIKEKDDAYLHLSSTMNDNSTIAAAMNFAQVDRIKNEIAWVKSLESGWNRVWFAIQGPGGKKGAGGHMNVAAADNALTSELLDDPAGYMASAYATESFGTGSASEGTGGGVYGVGSWRKEAVGKYSMGASLSTYKKSRAGGGGRKKRSWWDDYLEAMARALEKEAQYVLKQEEREDKRRYSEARKEWEAGVKSDAASERLRLEMDFKKFTEQAGRNKKGGKLGKTFAGGLFGDEVLQGALRDKEALAIYERQVESLNASVKDFTEGSLANFAGGLWAAADAAIQGGQGFGTAMLMMVKSTLLGIAQQATVKAIFSTAEGFALQAATMGIPNPGSVAAFTAAGLYAAVAAGAGVSGLALSAATAGGGRSSGAGAGASSGANYRPSFGTKSSSKDLPPIVVRVTFDRSDPASVDFARRKVHADLVSAGYSEGG